MIARTEDHKRNISLSRRGLSFERKSRAQSCREWRARNQEKVREFYLKSNHGPEAVVAFKELWLKQEGSCAICDRDLMRCGKGGSHLDHDHKTGEHRGILCNPCNRMLGFARDNPDVLRRAADYVGENRVER